MIDTITIFRFKTLTRGSKKSKDASGENREVAVVLQDYEPDNIESEFTSCFKGQQVEVISRLPDKTVVVSQDCAMLLLLLLVFFFGVYLSSSFPYQL